MEGIKPKSLQKALGKVIGQAAQDIQDDERMEAYERLAKMQAQQQLDFAAWHNPLNTLNAQNQYPYTTTNVGVSSQLGGSITGGVTMGGAGSPYRGLAQQQSLYPAPVTLTDEQMSLLMEKLAHALAKGWECIRCHRIWSPRETGCEFCNFIDRLEGKDVERD